MREERQGNEGQEDVQPAVEQVFGGSERTRRWFRVAMRAVEERGGFS